ncbi:ABC transporter ATP-binding protein [Bifidobacterium sp. W8101]|uniref:ABC transporter ATP-binding protein n=1 Tax=Bifidobacterium TaxID=1678 RepID=UPI0018DC4314|nr:MULTISPECIES: ABC transporter ATP-binding protein [Bifidobacterium]MBI0126312.1 ABC transporter ATP-binding protein [Bifidobacterium choladohabitans]MBI0127881.1 ABC transporter ATP-binding protein [Bifidobacterium sp. W8103]MBI0138469.1 ABC transporter ATP-binding protein [Bifidobacterium sp. W8105]MBI0148561.1 ABC transporter ATP-binding protein [Bifidobacterium sp. W8107]
MGNIEVSVSNLTVRIKNKTILSHLSLEVEEGAFHGVIGPNGAGKTTLFTVLEGLQKPVEGTVSVLGQTPYPRNLALLRQIGIQPQKSSFFPKTTLLEHLTAVADIYQVPRSRVDDLIDALKLDHVASNKVESLSGGEQQRLAIATAVVHHPRLLFLDEPTAALDPESRHDLVSLLKSSQQLAATVLYTTHHLDEAERLCNVVSILAYKHILVTASPSKLIAQAEMESTILLPNALDQADHVARLVGADYVKATPDGLIVRTRDTGVTFAKLVDSGINTSQAQVKDGRLEDVYLRLLEKENVK